MSFALLGVDWVQPHTIKEVLMAWRRRMKRCWLQGIWKMNPLAISWSTWKERNQRIFEGKARSSQEFKLYFLRTLCSWNQVLNDGTYINFLNFVDKINLESMRA